VHVMTSIMCFTADSPMHAEITNTHIPGNALNLCRYCVLRSATLEDRKKLPYVANFFQKSLHGSNVRTVVFCFYSSNQNHSEWSFWNLSIKCPNNLRTKEKTIENSKEL
jgi:hypothetical protein